MKKLIILLCFLLSSASTQAILLTDLLNGEELIVNDKRFWGWEVLFEESSDFRNFDYDNIEITGLVDDGLDPGPGLRFDIDNGMFDITGDGVFAYIDFMFGFYVSVLDPRLAVKDNSLSLTGYELINSQEITSVFIEETIYDSSGNELGVKDVEASYVFGVETEKLTDRADFAPTQNIWVTKNILLEAWNMDESVSLTSFEQRFSQTTIPEPGVATLFLFGLTLLLLRQVRH